jgi:hypothetical protein
MLIVDLIGKRIGGIAKVKDIRNYGLLKASQMYGSEA